MKIIVSAGGTGGHLYPALALVEYIKTQDIKAEFLFVGTTDRLESQVVPQKGYAYKGLKVKGLVGNPLQKIKNAMIFVKSLKESKKILKEFQPGYCCRIWGISKCFNCFSCSKDEYSYNDS